MNTLVLLTTIIVVVSSSSMASLDCFRPSKDCMMYNGDTNPSEIPPFSLGSSTTQFQPGEPITIRISGSQNIQGFLLYSQNSLGDRVGNWTLIPFTHIVTWLPGCSEGSTVSHAYNPKGFGYEVALNYTPPNDTISTTITFGGIAVRTPLIWHELPPVTIKSLDLLKQNSERKETDCQPLCSFRECGDDGCGGMCPDCPRSFYCSNHLCVYNCTPNCANKVCGDDGCYGQCGICSPSMACSDGLCTVPPVPNTLSPSLPEIHVQQESMDKNVTQTDLENNENQIEFQEKKDKKQSEEHQLDETEHKKKKKKKKTKKQKKSRHQKKN